MLGSNSAPNRACACAGKASCTRRRCCWAWCSCTLPSTWPRATTMSPVWPQDGGVTENFSFYFVSLFPSLFFSLFLFGPRTTSMPEPFLNHALISTIVVSTTNPRRVSPLLHVTTNSRRVSPLLHVTASTSSDKPSRNPGTSLGKMSASKQLTHFTHARTYTLLVALIPSS